MKLELDTYSVRFMFKMKNIGRYHKCHYYTVILLNNVWPLTFFDDHLHCTTIQT